MYLVPAYSHTYPCMPHPQPHPPYKSNPQHPLANQIPSPSLIFQCHHTTPQPQTRPAARPLASPARLPLPGSHVPIPPRMQPPSAGMRMRMRCGMTTWGRWRLPIYRCSIQPASQPSVHCSAYLPAYRTDGRTVLLWLASTWLLDWLVGDGRSISASGECCGEERFGGHVSGCEYRDDGWEVRGEGGEAG